MSEASAAEEDTTFVPAAGMVEKPDKLPEINGPRYRTRDDFNHIPDHNIRRHAWQEYQRTIEEFRQAGTVQEKEREDFAPHFINPPGLHHVMFMAHAEALDEIKRWQEARAQHQAEQAAAAEEAERLRAVRQGLHDQIAARGEVAPVQAAPEAEIAESVDPATRLQRSKAQLWAKIAAAEQAREDARPAPACAGGTRATAGAGAAGPVARRRVRSGCAQPYLPLPAEGAAARRRALARSAAAGR